MAEAKSTAWAMSARFTAAAIVCGALYTLDMFGWRAAWHWYDWLGFFFLLIGVSTTFAALQGKP